MHVHYSIFVAGWFESLKRSSVNDFNFNSCNFFQFYGLEKSHLFMLFISHTDLVIVLCL